MKLKYLSLFLAIFTVLVSCKNTEQDKYTIYATGSDGITFSPASITVNKGEQAYFSFKRDIGLGVDIKGCKGEIKSGVYITEKIHKACDIKATPISISFFSGKVKNAHTQQPIAGVKVSIVEDNISVFTDEQGQYSLPPLNNQYKTITVEHSDYLFEEKSAQLANNELTFLLKKRIKSKATLRWESYLQQNNNRLSYKNNPDWAVNFTQSKLTGDFAPNRHITRRDPSAVITVNGLYYVWYSYCLGDVVGFGSGDPQAKVFPWDKCDLYYGTSQDGYHWKEQGLAITRGNTGEYDDRSVFTPEILAHKGVYYLVYQAVKAPYVERVKNTVAMAWSNSPNGPWEKLTQPILKATNNGIWKGEEDNRFLVHKKGDFDSHKVHDPTLLFFNNKFYLYYKGERMGEQRYFGQREIKWGVAIADNPFGPYEKSQSNPITNSGHELVIWKYKNGIALINTLDGPERGTIQFAQDGINFEIMSSARNLPHAQGLFRDELSFTNPLQGVKWGLSHVLVWDKPGGWMYLNRFDIVN